MRARQPLKTGRDRDISAFGARQPCSIQLSRPGQNTCIRADTILGIWCRSLTAKRAYVPCKCPNTYPAFKQKSRIYILLFNTKLMHRYLHHIDFNLVVEFHKAKLRKWQILVVFWNIKFPEYCLNIVCRHNKRFRRLIRLIL